MLQISCGAMDGRRVVVATFPSLSAREPFEVSKIMRSAGDYGVRCENSKKLRALRSDLRICRVLKMQLDDVV